MRVLVCGGRDFDDLALLGRALDMIHSRSPIALLIHGGENSADTAAHNWASFREIPVKVFYADWGQFGSNAVLIRNNKMLAEGKPDLVVAFPGGKGIANMIKQARAAGVETVLIDTPQRWLIADTSTEPEKVKRAFSAREKALEYAVNLFQHHTSFAIEDVVLRVAVKFEDYLLNGNRPA
jgi:hypothetical protein